MINSVSILDFEQTETIASGIYLGLDYIGIYIYGYVYI